MRQHLEQFLWLIGPLLLAGTVQAASSGPISRDHVVVELISEVETVQPGAPFRVGLHMRHDEDWHTYWINPGDSGLETRFSFDLPAGGEAGPIQWPYPRRLAVGHLVNYGYTGEHLLAAEITPPPDLEPGGTFDIALRADWLICEVECIPGDVETGLSLPVTAATPAIATAQQGRFQRLDRQLPRAVSWPATFATDGGHLSLEVITDGRFDDADSIRFFAAATDLVEHAQPARLRLEGDRLFLSQPLNTYFSGSPESFELVLVDGEDTAVSVQARAGELGLESVADGAGIGIAAALLMALAGGVLLNLMPCVFPVLSLKALSIADGAGRPAAHNRAHALAYTVGVVASFAVVAGLLLALRAGGAAIGWGFQLQSAWFIGLLAYIMFGLALSLSGVVQFGTRLMGTGQGLTEGNGLKGSFFTGVLACIVASPCTAPFMGAALGFAVLQSWPLALAIFVSLGLGLALPMLLLGFLPGLARWLPKPGAWMDTFKQAMAFPLYLTVVWLLWVLARQTDANGLAAVLAGLVALAFALWLWGRGQGGRRRLVEVRDAVVALSLLAALVLLGLPAASEAPEVAADAWWEPYSAQRLEALRREGGRPVFVNMTADWCVTCLVNERIALNTDAVRQRMQSQDVIYLKGDWTRRDPAITEFLAEFDRNGVPLYVLYPAETDSRPRVLPQILTPGLVLDALERL